MSSRLSLAARALVLLALLIPALAAAVEDTKAAPTLADHRDELSSLEGALERGRITEARVGSQIQQATLLRTRFNGCSTDVDSQLQRLRASIASVAPVTPTETRVESEELDKLKAQQATLESIATECRLLTVRADDLVTRLTILQQELVTRRLLIRGQSGFDTVLDNLRQPTDWWTAGIAFIAERSGVQAINAFHIAFMALASVVAMLGGGLLSRRLSALASPATGDAFAARLAEALLRTLARYIVPLLLLGALSIYLLLLNWGLDQTPFLNALVYSLLAFVATLASVRVLLYPVPPARQLTPLPDDIARAMARRIRVLLVVLLVAALVFLTALAESLPDHVYSLVRLVIVTALVLNSVWLVWLVGLIPQLRRSGRNLRRVLIVLLASAGASEWLGFGNLSQFLLTGLSQTVTTVVVFWMAWALIRDVFDGLDVGGREWQRRLRASLGVAADEPLPGLVWLRLLVSLLIAGAFGLELLRIWGLSDAGFSIIVKYLVDGFVVFGVRIVPSKVVVGLLLFAVLVALARALAEFLDSKAAFQRRLDAGAREALVKITGYVGVIIAVLVGLSVAGVDFSNLAIVAGALSVGIGFGLQNIVNNFVSGVILLFERPVRTGDWIVVGQTEGIVRRINVRSTEIQTFERSHVIVPNAEFISGVVKNWTLHDRYGRLIVNVVVAHGCHTRRVLEILLEIAHGHPAVVSDPQVGEPKAYLAGFVERGLRFELRCVVRDVGDALDVNSDLNVAIEERLRLAGMEISWLDPSRPI